MPRLASAAVALAAALLFAPGAAALELAEILQRAVDHDAQAQALRASLENALIAAKRADLDPGFSVSLTSGRLRLSRSDTPLYDDPAAALSLSPGVTIRLASPLGTEVSVSVPTTFDLEALSTRRTAPTVKITQPLNDLLGIERDTLADLELARAVEEARVDLEKRVRSVETDALTRLRALWAGESTLGDLAVQTLAARRDLEQAQALGTYAPGSAALARLELALRSLERKRELQEARQRRELSDLGRIIGAALDSLPAAVPSAALALPSEEEAAAGDDVSLARLALGVEDLRLREQLEGKKPQLSVNGSYTRTISERRGREVTTNDASLGVGLAFDHLSVSVGPGISSEETDSERNDILYFGAEVSWSPPARRLEELDDAKQRNVVAAKQAQIAAAERSWLQTRAELESRILDLRLQAEDLALSRSVAELALAETVTRHASGLADDQELAEARWALERVGCDEKLLAVDRLLARVELEALTARSKEK